MPMDPLLTRLRSLTEDDIIEACEASYAQIEARPDELLELFHAVLDFVGVPVIAE